MIKRHFVALAITLSVYYLPDMLYHVYGALAWLNSALWSVIYIVLIYKCARTRLSPLILSCEFAALAMSVLAGYQDLTERGFYYYNFASTVNAVFIAELLIIGVGISQSGIIKRIYTFWLRSTHGDPHDHRSLLSSEKLV